MAKSFKDAVILGSWVDINSFNNYLSEEFTFTLDEKIKQKGLGKNMRLTPQECLSYASENFEIKKGDILFTGTPEGVGAVASGSIGNLKWGNQINFNVAWK